MQVGTGPTPGIDGTEGAEGRVRRAPPPSPRKRRGVGGGPHPPLTVFPTFPINPRVGRGCIFRGGRGVAVPPPTRRFFFGSQKTPSDDHPLTQSFFRATETARGGHSLRKTEGLRKEPAWSVSTLKPMDSQVSQKRRVAKARAGGGGGTAQGPSDMVHGL